MIDKVQDPERYRHVDQDRALPRQRVRGLPKDDARQALSSHQTRLLNMDRSRLSDAEKKTLDVRRGNLRQAEKLYVAAQAKALGVAIDKGHGVERGR